METEHSQRWHDRQDVHEVKAYVKGFKVRMDARVWSKMMAWCQAAKSEVSGLFLVDRQGDVFKCYDVFLPKQSCTSSSTELDDDAVIGLMDTCKKRGVPMSHLRGWWHTHYDFSVFWSGTDIDTCETLLGSSGDWALSIVINQKGEYKCRIDVMRPFRFSIDNLDVEMQHPAYMTEEKAKQDVEKMVKAPYAIISRTPHTDGYGYGHGYGYNVDNDEAWKKKWANRKWDDTKREWVDAIEDQPAAKANKHLTRKQVKAIARAMARAEGGKNGNGVKAWPQSQEYHYEKARGQDRAGTGPGLFDHNEKEAKPTSAVNNEKFFGFKIERDLEKEDLFIVDGQHTLTGQELVEMGIASQEELKDVPRQR